jgi:ankyrin repeat protein
MLAAGWNSPDVVARLLAAGARVEARSTKGETALSLARRNGRSENVALLEGAGASAR